MPSGISREQASLVLNDTLQETEMESSCFDLYILRFSCATPPLISPGATHHLLLLGLWGW